ncbi:hypothetical protein AB0N09_39980 [Streptomyces erythrochromogenes]|uniref:hypothetical protein n=1 Tax=Streptomyces erythrochromogenes TaxID=285574 RepID=UPI003413CD55
MGEVVAAEAAGAGFVVAAEVVDGSVGVLVVQTADGLVTLSTAYRAPGFDPAQASVLLAGFGFTTAGWERAGEGRYASRAVHERRQTG